MNIRATLFLSTVVTFIGISAARAGDVELLDPAGDDFGPGSYVYPTAPDYKKGSFDLRGVVIKDKGDTLDISVSIAVTVTDPWNSKDWQGNGFSLQYVMIFVDTDHKAGSGITTSVPGLNIGFAPEEAWDKVILISPQPKSRLLSEIKTKAATLKDRIVIPSKTSVRGKELIASVKKADLGGGDPTTWGFAVVMQSNEGYPAPTDLLTRKVNEMEGEHRFGGGTDYDCDPHVLDIIVPPAKGGADEVALQKKALSYECNADGSAKKLAIVPMVYKK